LPFHFSLQGSLAGLEIETRPKFRGNDRTQVFPFAENTVANARDKIIGPIAERPRNYSKECRDELPASAKPPENVEEGIRSHKQGALSSKHDDSIGQTHAVRNRNPPEKCVALQWRESKSIPGSVIPEHELHAAVAQAAVPIVEDQLGLGGGRATHSLKISTAGDLGLSRRGIAAAGNCRWTVFREDSKLR
jgi:hypothetical protein